MSEKKVETEMKTTPATESVKDTELTMRDEELKKMREELKKMHEYIKEFRAFGLSEKAAETEVRITPVTESVNMSSIECVLKIKD